MEHYFIIKNEEQKGPFNLNEIIEMNLSEDTLIWKKELKDWIQLKDLPEYNKNVPPPIPKTEQPKIQVNIEDIKDNYVGLTNKDEITDSVSNIESITTNNENAGFLLRLAAFFIDFAFMFFLTSFIWAFLQLPIPLNSKSLFSGSFLVFKNPLGILFGWFFYALFESSKFQATPGKAILGLKVTDDKFEKIGFGQASGRFFGKILSGLILGIGYIMIAFTKNKQGLHDQMAHTFVLKENVKGIKRTTPSWIVLITAFVLFIISLFIPANTDLIDTLDSFNANSYTSNSSEDKVNNISFSYAGISFDYPDNWKVEKEELQQDLAYQINCEKKGINSSEIISITWLNMEMEPREMIENTIEGMKEVPTHKNSNTKPIFKSVYKGFNAFKSDFDLVLFGEKFFGRIISFNASGKTILILKQTDRIDKLDSEFKIVENSLKIE